MLKVMLFNAEMERVKQNMLLFKVLTGADFGSKPPFRISPESISDVSIWFSISLESKEDPNEADSEETEEKESEVSTS